MSDTSVPSFSELNLSAPLLKALLEVGYEQPSPIQAQSIPPLLDGRDLLGIAQTGTGKTAAFALPLLSNLDLKQSKPQVLVLAPTRELAIQVAEAFQTYARHLKGFHVLPLYGGQDMRLQLRNLKRDVHVVVGTPGRIMDHLRRGSLDLSALTSVVLDEADEMLRMGFIEDVQWILDHTPEERQVALFSATMPSPIRKVASQYLKNPVEVQITRESTTVERIEQNYLLVQANRKMDALTRVMEVEEFDAAIIFVRTKTATIELADKLEARGLSASALNGDMNQNQREKVIERLKKSKLDVVVATDVAARGLDVERISHVINYDIPYDSEAYVHRIGRTGRAGRSGKAILLITPREQRLLKTIERHIQASIPLLKLPSAEELSEQRIRQFKNKVLDTVQEVAGRPEQELLSNIILEMNGLEDLEPLDLAVALAYLAQQENPLLIQAQKDDFALSPRDKKQTKEKRKKQDGSANKTANVDMEMYRIGVGRKDNVRPGDIVGAIANEAGIDSQYIGNIRLADTFSTVELPKGMPKEVFEHLKKVRIKDRSLEIRVWKDQTPKKPNKHHKGKKN